MSDWNPIGLGKAKVLGVNEEYPGLLEVDVPLEPRPDDHWSALFVAGPDGAPISVSMHPPRLEGTTVRLRPPDKEMKAYLDALRVRVDATNRQ